MITTTLMARWPVAAATALLCTALAQPCTAQTLACPAPHAAPGAGVLQETPVQIAETGRYLADDHGANRAADVVADLRARYPGVGDPELENFLVTAYCPVVAKLTGLSLPEQRARVDQFARQARAAVFGQ